MRYGSKWINGHKTYKEWPSQGKGLTLIEVLVLVACVAILAGLLLPVLSRARQSVREAAQKDKDGAVPVMPVQAEKSPVFPSGQEVVTVGRDDLEGYVAKTKKRIVSVTPLWKDSIGGGYRPTHYLIVMEGK